MASLSKSLLLVFTALTLQGCFAYCPLYATAGCLELETLDQLGQTEPGALLGYVQDERSWVREAAIQVVGRRQLHAGTPQLIEALLDPREKRYVRAAAATALANLEHRASLPDIARAAALPDAPPEFELAAIGALCRLGPQDAKTLGTLTLLANDEDLLVAASAQRHLATGCAQ